MTSGIPKMLVLGVIPMFFLKNRSSLEKVDNFRIPGPVAKSKNQGLFIFFVLDSLYLAIGSERQRGPSTGPFRSFQLKIQRPLKFCY